jgi:SAM-dependent methyltransferase
VGRFDSRAADYAAHRPGYPPAVVDVILDGLGDSSGLTAADIGAGTGISSRVLADRGVRVIAVEPNAAMRAAAGEHPRISWREGSAEATGLDAASVDLVLCAQSFHWFRVLESLLEFHRILRRGGRLAVVWNQDDLQDPFTEAVAGAIDEASVMNARHVREARGEDMVVSGLFHQAREFLFRHERALSLDQLFGWARSISHVPQEGAAHERLMQTLASIHAKYAGPDGAAVFRYRTSVYLAEAVVWSGMAGACR